MGRKVALLTSLNRGLWALKILFCTQVVTATTARVDSTHFNSGGEVRVSEENGRLTVRWPMDSGRIGEMDLSLDPAQPLISNIAIEANGSKSTSILHDVDPCGVLTVGTRDLKPAGWTIFFDNPPRRPWQGYPLKIARSAVHVVTENGRTSVVIDGASAGPFEGDYRFTFYPGSSLVRAAAVLSTKRDASAILFDTGLVARSGAAAPWTSIAWTDLSDKIARMASADVARDEAKPVKVRHRLIVAEGAGGGSLAIVPPPHQYFYPLDFVDNFATAWIGRDYRGVVSGGGFGVRQTLEGDHRWVPWMNAPPGTRQDLGVFYLLSDGDAAHVSAEALAYTHNDQFKPIDGYKTFTSHYHVEHTMDFLNQQKAQHTDGVPKGLETPAFVARFKSMGVDAAHLAEFHAGDGELKIAGRLERLKTLHAECERLSNDQFLLIPGEEPNVHLGGHWLSLFPKPVYWTLNRTADQPFVEEVAPYGKVYHVGDADDVLKLMEAENGLMWTAHPRIKASTGFPDVYRHSAYFASDHFLGGAWKAMPADCSLPRLGTRVLDLLDDMNNWGAHKQAPGEVDVFKINADSELYAHMNVNYLQLDHLPKFSSGWQEILDTLRAGRFFTTTGEVLIPSFSIDGKRSGETLNAPSGPSQLQAAIDWTFPLAFAEVVSGDGANVFRQRIDLHDTRAFDHRELKVPVDLHGRTWARFEVWDVATDGAYTQPIWIKRDVN